MQDGQWIAFCDPSFQFDHTGDMANPSMVWIQRYYDELLTVKQLIPLAAYTIRCAHELNTAGIGGLEIVTCDSSGINFVPRPRILELRRTANEFGKENRRIAFQSPCVAPYSFEAVNHPSAVFSPRYP